MEFACVAFARFLLVLLVLLVVLVLPGLLARVDFDSSASCFALASLLASGRCIGHGSSVNNFLPDH